MSKYIIDNLPDYFKQYEKSVHDPEKFWEQIADKNFIWNKKWDSVLEYDGLRMQNSILQRTVSTAI